MTKTALLLIDLQNEVIHPEGTLAGDLPKIADRLLNAVRQLVGWARDRDVPLIWIRIAFRPGYIDASRSMRDSAAELNGRFLDGSWGAKIVDGIGLQEGDIVITKKRSSAFASTELDFVLRGLDIERLIVAGTSTNWAVEATVRDAESLDYRVTVVREATGARAGEFHEHALGSMATRYAEVKTLAEVLATPA